MPAVVDCHAAARKTMPASRYSAKKLCFDRCTTGNNERELECARIVIIENNALVAMAMDDTLTDAGHFVVGIAGHVEIGTEIILKIRPDLLLIDLKLAKETTGADLIDAIREHVTIPTLFVSSAAAECRKLGYAYAYGCLHKPFNATQLVEAVEAVSLIARGRKPGKLPANLELYEPLRA